MAWKDPEARRAYDHEWSKKNRALRKQLNDTWRNGRADWFKDFKKTLSCNRCPENHPATLQFHHEDPAAKEGAISDMMRRRSKENVLAEMAKCEVLCANCHAKHHAEELVDT